MWDSKLFKVGIGILLVFLIIYMGSQINFIFYPLVVIFETLFISFFVAGVLFYLTFPLCDWLSKGKIPRPLAIVFVFLVIIGLLVLLGLATGPIVVDEFNKLMVSVPEKIESAERLIENLRDYPIFNAIIDFDAIDLDNMTDRLADLASTAASSVVSSVANLVDFLTELFLTVIIVPFLLYYMLRQKDQNIIPGLVDRYVLGDYAGDINKTLAEMNKMLGSYFQGLAVVCFLVGVMAYIGFLIIGLEFALILAIFIMFTNIVPWIGPFLGAIPAVIVGLIDSPFMMPQVIIVILIVQQLESLVISPQVMGRKLSLNPMAIILVVLVAGRLGGLFGIILAVPTFTALKIIINNIYDYIRVHIKPESGIKL